jgi:hypothetical protein
VALRSAIEDLQSLKTKVAEIQGGLSGAYSATVFKEDLRAFLAGWRTASEANFLFRGSRQN